MTRPAAAPDPGGPRALHAPRHGGIAAPRAYDPAARAASLSGAPLRAALVADAGAWLQALLGEPGPGVALVAVGALGRRELVPGSDLDLLLLHDPRRTDAAKIAAGLWYAIWDAGVALDHSVRTPQQVRDIAGADLKAALGLLDLRHVGGDPLLAAAVREDVYAAWRSGARRRLPEVVAAARERAARAGELAFLLEPDLKEARGGLRDALVPRQVAAAQVGDPPGESLGAASALLLDVRGALHSRAVAAGRRPSDRLFLQEQDAVALDLRRDDVEPTADALMAAVAGAARTISWALDATVRRVDAWATPTRRTGLLRREARRRPLVDGLVAQGGEVVLARDADPAHDPALVLRAARAAAESGLPLSPYTLSRLRTEGCTVPEPWPGGVLDAFLALLGSGRAAVGVLETLDAQGLLERWLPEWPRVRSRPQRNAFHTYTVDRHLLESVAEAAALTRDVARPDLLLLAALLHDLGKGWPGEDHTAAGIREVPLVARRMGLPDADGDVLVTLVRCHLLLAETATTRDLADPDTAAAVAAAVGSREVLHLLRALTEADSLATGPSMWSRWKAGLLDDLVRRAAAVLEGELVPEPAGPTAAERALLARGELDVRLAEPGTVTVVAPDSPGLLAVVAGVLALHKLDLRGVDASAGAGMALVVASATSRFGSALPDAALVRTDLRRALDGDLDLALRLRDREAAYPEPPRALVAPPRVLWADEASRAASVVELRAPDALGLLARVALALSLCGVALRSARCTTLGVEAVDAFYLTEPDGSLVPTGERRRAIGAALLAAAAPR